MAQPKLLNKIILLAIALLLSFFGIQYFLTDRETPTEIYYQTPPKIETQNPAPNLELPKEVLLDVPFVAQAPNANWDDPRQQDGCEEAASYMAYLWATGEVAPNSQEQERKIVEISNWEEEKYGGYHDTSAKDTGERILKGYFRYENFEVKYDVDAEDIKKELAEGDLVIAPADGQAIGNPYFTAPGPERHFLAIIGYYEDEFITNDNGTKRGKGFKYKTNQLVNSLRDYPTGDHVPITENRKAIIVVSKSQ